MEDNLLDTTIRLLHECDMTIPEVYAGLAQGGSDITYYWLRKFSAGNFKDPSVNRVQEVYEYLSGKSLLNPAP